VLIHALGTSYWVGYLVKRHLGSGGHWRPKSDLWVLISTAVVLLGLHLLEVMLWALTYLWWVPAGQLDSFEEATYFSFVTFTTLGYGDITLSSEWRLLSGIEAFIGILLVGWTTALLFTVLQRSLRLAGDGSK
jgi:hypothetical protein